MTAATGVQLSVGLRYANVFLLDANGYIAATSTTVYTGRQVSGSKAFTINVPEPRVITHTGDDRVLARDFLPPLEGVGGELRVAKNDYTTIALLTGVSVSTIANSKGVAYGTDKQGYEPIVGGFFYQQSLSVTGGTRAWRAVFIPRMKAIPLPGNMDENATEMRFIITATNTSMKLWGAAVSTSTDGATEEQFDERMFDYEPNLIAFLGDNSTVAFTVPSTASPYSPSTAMAVYVNGTLKTYTTDYTVSGDTITFGSAPATGANISVLYETSD